MANRIPRPDWYSKPPDEWPSSAREFYRLCWVIGRRVKIKKALQQAGELSLPPDADQGIGRS